MLKQTSVQKKIRIDRVTEFNVSFVKMSKITCYAFKIKVFQQVLQVLVDIWKPFMPSKYIKTRIKTTRPHVTKTRLALVTKI